MEYSNIPLEYYEVDPITGERLNAHLLLPYDVPQSNYYLSWGDEMFVNPKWDFTLNCWVESESIEDILSRAKDKKKNELKGICDATIIEGFTSSNGHRYRTNDRDQSNMMARKEYLNDHPEEQAVRWLTEDSGYVDHTRDEWINQVFYEGFTHIEQNIFKYNSLKQELKVLTTKDEVELITWE